VFGAWTNLVDWKAGNALDVLVEKDGRTVVKHYLQDVGSTFGMANNPHEYDMGWEYFYEQAPSRRRLYSFGFALSPWQTAPYTKYSSIGFFEGDRFEPRSWRPQTPVEPFIQIGDDDAFWAARRVMAFTDDLIRAVVRSGEYSNPAAEKYLADVLIKRRDAIGRVYLPAVNPVVNPRLDATGSLTFENAAVAAGFAESPTGYRPHGRDSTTPRAQRTLSPKPAAQRPRCPRPAISRPPSELRPDRHLGRERRSPDMAAAGAHALRRDAGGWKLVGLVRRPDQPAGATPAVPATRKTREHAAAASGRRLCRVPINARQRLARASSLPDCGRPRGARARCS
jgi:hypothetical protein